MPKASKDMIKKQFVAEVKIDTDDERAIVAIISTSAVDRDREVVSSKGAILDSFLKNPVVLWAHRSGETPIAKALWIKKGRNKLTAKLQFAETEKAEEVFQLFKGGFLSAFSIGFIPLKSHSPEPDEIKKRPELANVHRIIDEWELLEFSAVPVPANQEALATAVKEHNITLSKSMLDELEIEDEETYYPTENAAPAKSKEAKDDEIPVEVKAVTIEVETMPIEVEKIAVPVEPFVDVKAVVVEAIKTKKGTMY